MTFRNFLKDNDSIPEDAQELQSQKYENVRGKIFHLNTEEGWGFIEATNQPEIKFKRIYFHWQWLLIDTLEFEYLEKGMEVEFEAREHPKGWRAIKIRVIEKKEEKKNA